MDILRKNAREWLQASTRRSFHAVLEEAKITPRQIQICELKFVNMILNVSVKTVEKDLSTAYESINKVLSE